MDPVLKQCNSDENLLFGNLLLQTKMNVCKI